MKILSSSLYENQLKEILQKVAQENFDVAKKFKLYLDTIIINIPTKASKYKVSSCFNDENVKEIEYESFLIHFYIDEQPKIYLILGITEKIS